jgi:hypothetical protein
MYQILRIGISSHWGGHATWGSPCCRDKVRRRSSFFSYLVLLHTYNSSISMTFVVSLWFKSWTRPFFSKSTTLKKLSTFSAAKLRPPYVRILAPSLIWTKGLRLFWNSLFHRYFARKQIARFISWCAHLISFSFHDMQKTSKISPHGFLSYTNTWQSMHFLILN